MNEQKAFVIIVIALLAFFAVGGLVEHLTDDGDVKLEEKDIRVSITDEKAVLITTRSGRVIEFSKDAAMKFVQSLIVSETIEVAPGSDDEPAVRPASSKQ